MFNKSKFCLFTFSILCVKKVRTRAIGSNARAFRVTDGNRKEARDQTFLSSALFSTSCKKY